MLGGGGRSKLPRRALLCLPAPPTCLMYLYTGGVRLCPFPYVCSPPVLAPRAPDPLSGVNNDVYCLPVLEARIPRSRCLHGFGCEGEAVLRLSPSFWCFASNLCCSLACRLVTWISASFSAWHPPLCMSVSKFPFLSGRQSCRNCPPPTMTSAELLHLQ